ncbi:metal-dependent hydrolase [Ensifer sp. IC3342]|nr:metal-dependent hydrolase [Ensifer sp. BRP08]MCA1450568.1 metal-dependent hydrolase [Ensifer sp. IC3342]
MARKRETAWRGLLAVGLLCSVLPDFDLIYFYLVDHRRTLHHDYWTHTPLFWIATAAVIGLVLLFSGKRERLIFVWAGLLNILLHLAMDSVAADIRWFYPLSEARLNLVHIPARYSPWFLNFLLHWTFAVELMILVAAIVVLLKSRRRRGFATSPATIS